jgi:peptidoglycan/LPS O-acetylase OafA/YrhL
VQTAASAVPEPAVAPPPGHPRFPLFDGLRAVAALAVVVYHTAFVSHADQNDAYGPLLAHLNIGVPVFFVISGFLLYRPFVAARLEGRPGPTLGGFARRRFLRIVPAYWVALTLLAIWPGVRGLFTGDWPIYYGFAQVYSTDTVVNGIPQAWTLGTEIAFYAVLPLYAWALARRRATARTELAVLALLAIAALACRTVAQGGGHGGPFWTLGLPGTFDWFAVGMALAVVSSAPDLGALRERIAARAAAAWIAAIALYLVLSYVVGLPKGYVFVQRYSYFQAFSEHLLSGLIAGCLALPAVVGRRTGGLPRRLLGAPVMAWLGLVSYGIYLWHFSLISELNDRGVDRFIPLTVSSLAVTIAVAGLSYYVVERPALRLKGGSRRRGAP